MKRPAAGWLTAMFLVFSAGCVGHRNVLPLVAESGDNAWGENLTQRRWFAPVEQVTAACSAAARAGGWELTDLCAAPEKRAAAVRPLVQDGNNEPTDATTGTARKTSARVRLEVAAAEKKWRLKRSDGKKAHLFLISMGPRCTKTVLLWENVRGRSARNGLSNDFFREVKKKLAEMLPPVASVPRPPADRGK